MGETRVRLVLTAGPTREPLDPVRYLGNRSTGKMGQAIAEAAVRRGIETTVISGPVEVRYPAGARVIWVETAQQMHDATLGELAGERANAAELVILAAAVADYRPAAVAAEKMSRAEGPVSIVLEPTADIAAAVGAGKRPGQRVVGFSLEREGNRERARQKLRRKNLDMIVYNPLATMGAESVTATLIYASGEEVEIGYRSKADFADVLLQRALALFPS